MIPLELPLLFNKKKFFVQFKFQLKKFQPPPSVSTEITIILTDVNDETPTFHSSGYEAEIRENAQENTPVTFLGDNKNWVYDFDQGNNGTFELFFDADDHIFEVTPKRAINEASFLIRVRDNRKLDYELIQQMNYTLIAREVVKNGKWKYVCNWSAVASDNRLR